MKKLISCAFLAIAFLTPALAVEPEHQAAIEKMFKLMHQQEQYETSMTAGFESALGGAVDQMPEEQKAKFKVAIERVKEFMKAEIGWDKMKGELVELYAQNLTLAEINAVLPLLEKPEFQTVVVKQLKVLPEAAKMGATKAQALQPKIMQIIQEEMTK
ncbi:hypothetical protein GCM10023213_37920 [Prosthecobacter algae]|jgi:uncharacterized protein|uniref:DUF2059 domain-containing protein n=1 Tax=Prosthecobacter algae TaxID=1144682 RepID=A0ABP9PFJ7_9BACT|nr:hypothetical protein [Verrucomicrobiales bacterium]